MKLNKNICLTLGTIVTVLTPIAAAVSCDSSEKKDEVVIPGKSDPKPITPEIVPKQTNKEPTIVQGASTLKLWDSTDGTGKIEANSNGFGNDYYLTKDAYNDLYHKLDDHKVGIAIVAAHKIYEDVIEVTKGETVLEALDHSHFHFNRYMHEYMGAFLNSFYLKDDDTKTLIHGTRTSKNYGDYYPMYYINHKFAQLGVSNFHLAGHEMLEFSFDDK